MALLVPSADAPAPVTSALVGSALSLVGGWVLRPWPKAGSKAGRFIALPRPDKLSPCWQPNWLSVVV